MGALKQPTWQLVLEVAQRLDETSGDFRLAEIVEEIQRMDPSRGQTSIHPVVQGMTVNAGKGPLSPCGQPLVRVSHGIYCLTGNANHLNVLESRSLASSSPNLKNLAKIKSNPIREQRIEAVINEFPTFVLGYDQQIPFTRIGQFSLHRSTIERRRSFPNVHEALKDDAFLANFRQTLYAWGIGKRASRLVALEEFSNRIRSCEDEISTFENFRLDDPQLDIVRTAENLWHLIERLEVVQNTSLIVPGTKTLHHLLPDLVPPMDRAWTGQFFLWSMGSPAYERSTFVATFTSFAKIAQNVDPESFVGAGWRTSLTKVLDNAVIGYCKINGISPRGA